jgi:hypothetical protein
VDESTELSYQNLIDTGFFIKLDSMDQVKRLSRTKMDSTLEWWKKQTSYAKETNLIPQTSDVKAEEAIELFNKWFTSKPNWKEDLVWVRGSMDQPVFESLHRAMGIESKIPYNKFRDIRTALQCFYPNEKGGYIDIDVKKVPDYDSSKVFPHHPLHDSARDLCMLLGAKTE